MCCSLQSLKETVPSLALSTHLLFHRIPRDKGDGASQCIGVAAIAIIGSIPIVNVIANNTVGFTTESPLRVKIIDGIALLTVVPVINTLVMCKFLAATCNPSIALIDKKV